MEQTAGASSGSNVIAIATPAPVSPPAQMDIQKEEAVSDDEDLPDAKDEKFTLVGNQNKAKKQRRETAKAKGPKVVSKNKT